MQEPQPVFEHLGYDIELVGSFMGCVCPPEDVDESIPVDEFPGGQSACRGLFFWVVTVRVP